MRVLFFVRNCQEFRENALRIVQNHNLLDYIFKFADVAGPMPLLQLREVLRIQIWARSPLQPRMFFEKQLGKRRQIFLAFPQRQEVQASPLESIKQLRPETIGTDFFLQIQRG